MTPRQWLVATLTFVSVIASALILREPLAAFALSCLAILVWARLPLHLATSSDMVRRLIKFLPYAAGLGSLVFPVPLSFFGVVLATMAGTVLTLLGWRSLREALDPVLLALLPRETASRRWSESVFYIMSAICQEFLHRGLLMFGLMSLGAPGWGAALAAALTFSAEHFTVRARHIDQTWRQALEWFAMGIVFGGLVVITSSWLAAAIAHLIVNIPSMIRPHLMGRGSLHVQSAQV